jgi:hypothetical protein
MTLVADEGLALRLKSPSTTGSTRGDSTRHCLVTHGSNTSLSQEETFEPPSSPWSWLLRFFTINWDH